MCSVYVEDDISVSVPMAAQWLEADQTYVTFLMPPSVGRKRVYVSVDGQRSNALRFTYSPPSISSMSPSVLPTLGATDVVLRGESFGAADANCYLKAMVTFPPYSITVDTSDKVRARLARRMWSWMCFLLPKS